MTQDDDILYRLWDFRSPPPRNENLILAWGRNQTKKDRAKLNQKFRRLVQMDFKLAVDTRLLAGPIYEHIYKLVIHGDVMLRPMLCKGPLENDSEYTLLLGAVEVGGKLPAGSREKAEENRNAILQDDSRRCPHERIP